MIGNSIDIPWKETFPRSAPAGSEQSLRLAQIRHLITTSAPDRGSSCAIRMHELSNIAGDLSIRRRRRGPPVAIARGEAPARLNGGAGPCVILDARLSRSGIVVLRSCVAQICFPLHRMYSLARGHRCRLSVLSPGDSRIGACWISRHRSFPRENIKESTSWTQ